LANHLAKLLAEFEETSTPARARNIIQVTGDEDGEYFAYQDCARLARGVSREEASAAVVAGLNRAAVEQCTHFAVHSGVAAWPRGMVAIPAESGQGKTTLTASLVRLGFQYASDEALVFDAGGDVLPYPKPFALSTWSADLLGLPRNEGELLITAADLGGTVSEGGRLTDLVVSEYGHDDLCLQPIPKSQAVAALIQHSFNHYKDPKRAFRLATDVAREVRVWRLEYDDPLEAAELLYETLR